VSDVIGPDEIDKLRDPAKRLAAWRRLIADTVQSVTVAPAMTADGRPSRLWDPDRIDIRLQGQHPQRRARRRNARVFEEAIVTSDDRRRMKGVERARPGRARGLRLSGSSRSGDRFAARSVSRAPDAAAAAHHKLPVPSLVPM
jgi:hypothetical protein